MRTIRRKDVQSSVLRAVSRGYRYAENIAELCGLSKTETYNHLRRLIDKGLVECYKCRHSGGHKAYAIKTIKVILLEKLWTTEAQCHATGKKNTNSNSNEGMTKGKSKGKEPGGCTTSKALDAKGRTSTTRNRSVKVVSRRAVISA